MNTPTLAEKLGMTPRISMLLKKAQQLGLDSPESLESLAVARGCWHYRSPEVMPSPNISSKDFSNEELAVALLSPSFPYSAHTIRLGAAMLGASDNNVEELARLAIAEQTIAPVRYIAEAALRFEPDNPLWHDLLKLLPPTPPIPEGLMPHPTRFVSMTGMARGGIRPPPIWIRPRSDLAALHG